jgi:hypothetical protein
MLMASSRIYCSCRRAGRRGHLQRGGTVRQMFCILFSSVENGKVDREDQSLVGCLSRNVSFGVGRR